jgi:chromosome segregation ATPase
VVGGVRPGMATPQTTSGNRVTVVHSACSLENVLVGASTDTKPDSVRRREAALRRRVVDLTTLVQQHESFAEESRAAYESEITQLQQQLDEEQKLCDEFLNYSKGRKANEASALEALSECAVVSDAAGTNKGPSVNTLQAQLDDLTDDRDKTAERCASLGHECKELQLQLVEAHGVCASTKAELARISTEREQLAETERPAEPVDDAARIALQEQCATLTRECAELRQELGEARETSVADKADLVRITDEGVAALKDRNAVAIERDTLQADLAELTDEVEDAAASQAEFTALQADVAAALAIVSQHDAALSGTGSIESAMQSMATKLITAEDELIEVTQQLGEILELSNEAKLAELQAELDECHETIEHLAMQLEVDEESRDSTTL